MALVEVVRLDEITQKDRIYAKCKELKTESWNGTNITKAGKLEKIKEIEIYMEGQVKNQKKIVLG